MISRRNRQQSVAVFLVFVVVLSLGAIAAGPAGVSATEHTNPIMFSTHEPALVSDDRADAAVRSGGVLWEGQQVGLEIPKNSHTSETFELRQYDSSADQTGSFITEFSLDTDRQYILDTEGLTGEYVIVPAGQRGTVIQFNSSGVATGTTSSADANPFEIVTQSLDIAWDQTSVTTGDTEVDVDVQSNRARYNLNVSADGLDFDDLVAMFRSTEDQRTASDPYADRKPFADGHDTDDAHFDDDVLVVRGYNDGTLTANFSEIDPGTYTIEFTVTDTGVQSTTTADNGDTETDNGDDADDDAEAAFFELTALNPTETTVAPGETFVVTATVSNSGDTAATQTVSFQLGDEQATEEQSIDAGGSETVSASLTAPETPGTYSLQVETADDAIEGSVTVSADGETDSAPGDDTDDADELSDEAPGFALITAVGAVLASVLWMVRARLSETESIHQSN